MRIARGKSLAFATTGAAIILCAGGPASAACATGDGQKLAASSRPGVLAGPRIAASYVVFTSGPVDVVSGGAWSASPKIRSRYALMTVPPELDAATSATRYGRR